MTTSTVVQARFQLRADTAANWTSVNPILLANEFGLETDTKKLKVGNGSTAWSSLAYFPSIVSGGTVLGNLEIGTTGTLTFEGSTADGFETTLAVVDPTADRTITLPNQTGTVIVSGNASIVNADISATAEIAVSKLADGAARQLLQTDAAGTGVEWTDNVDIPGTLDVTSTATFDGNVTIAGDLTVNGTTTNINTQNLVVEDKNVILGDVATPTDVTADGGGITLKGTTDKTINWVDATDAWTLSEHVNIASGKEYRINGTKVLDGTSLGSGVTGSSLTSVGTIGTGVWQGTAINKSYLDSTLVSTGDTGTVTSTMIADGTIVDGDINASAAIADTKLATISTAGKVSNSATTATSANTASAIVARDASGNFSAGTITANLNGNASTVTTNANLTGDVTSVGNATSIAAGVIVDADVNASAAIAGTKISPDFGSQNTTTTGTSTAASFIPSSSTAPTNGVYLPAANSVGISTNSGERLRITSAGLVGIGTSSPAEQLDVATTNCTIRSTSTGNTSAKLALNSNRAASIINGQILGQWNENVVSRIDFYNGADGTNKDDGEIAFATANNSSNPIERMRITQAGRLLVGTTTSIDTRTYLSNNYGGPYIQTHGTDQAGSAHALYSWATNTNAPASISLNKSVSGAVGTRGALTVANSDLGAIVFAGDDGTNFIPGASILAEVDGTPGVDDMPGRIVLSTTADGASSPTEALRITNDRVICYNQPDLTSKSAAATLTVAELKTGIIQYTGAAATLTLPTGTLTDGGFSGIYTNMTFEWSVINTGSGTCTIGAGTAHTIVGAATITAGASGRFASRRTASNTFVSYRIA